MQRTRRGTRHRYAALRAVFRIAALALAGGGLGSRRALLRAGRPGRRVPSREQRRGEYKDKQGAQGSHTSVSFTINRRVAHHQGCVIDRGNALMAVLG
nr:hypothetical protein [Nitrosomonas nitrosa]